MKISIAKILHLKISLMKKSKHRTYLGQINEKLIRPLQFRRATTNFAPGILQFNGIHEFSAAIALISPGILVITARMRTTPSTNLSAK